MQDLIDRLREYASTRKGELAELITEAADALERQTCEDAVSRQQAIDAFKKELTIEEPKGKYATVFSGVSFYGAKQILEALPAVQSQGIIRCKDCMHNGSFDTDCPINWNGKEYCSFAERRTND